MLAKPFARSSLVLLIMLLASCRDLYTNGITKEERQKKLLRLADVGRRVTMLHGSTEPTYALVGETKVAERRDSVKNIVTWAAYNTDLMDAVGFAELIPYSLNFLDSSSAEFGVSSHALAVVKAQQIKVGDKLMAIKLPRWHNEIVVRDSFVEFKYVKAQSGVYKLREISNNSFGPIRVFNEESPFPSNEDVLSQSGFDQAKIISRSDLIFPRQNGDEIVFAKATEFEITLESDMDSYIVTLEAGSLNIIESFRKRFLEKFTFVGASYERSYVLNDKKELPLPFTELENDLFTDGDGAIVLQDISASATVRLTSFRAKVLVGEDFLVDVPADRLSDAQQVVSLSATQSGGKVSIDVDNVEDQAALNAYLAVHRIHRFVKRHLSEEDTSMLTLPLNIITNSLLPMQQDGELNHVGCNAAYFPDFFLIVFTPAYQNCANTALITDIVAHEWCHGLDDKTAMPGIRDAAFSEGIADVCSAYLTGSNVLGIGFINNQMSGIRNLDNANRYPDHISFMQAGQSIREPHHEGQIIGGAFWDLRAGLIKKHGREKGSHLAEELFFKHLLTTDTYLASYDAVLSLDDVENGDGNPATPAPNQCIINEAFASHGLSTLDAGCVESAASIKDALGNDLQANADLYLELAPASAHEGEFRLSASGQEIAKLELCRGQEEYCFAAGNEGKFAAVFTWDGSKNGRDFFKGPDKITLEGSAYMTLRATSYYGVKSYRTLKIIPK